MITSLKSYSALVQPLSAPGPVQQKLVPKLPRAMEEASSLFSEQMGAGGPTCLWYPEGNSQSSGNLKEREKVEVAWGCGSRGKGNQESTERQEGRRAKGVKGPNGRWYFMRLYSACKSHCFHHHCAQCWTVGTKCRCSGCCAAKSCLEGLPGFWWGSCCNMANMRDICLLWKQPH